MNMMITCLFLRMNRNDAFSSLRVGGYNNLLRFRLTEDGFDMYVVGLERVPRRKDWVANGKHDRTKPNPEVPVFVPMRELDPHLVETVSVRFAQKAG